MPTEDQKVNGNLEGLKLEFEVLKNETITRLELRLKLIELTLTFAAALAGAAFTIGDGRIALIYPPLAMFLAATWLHNDYLVHNIGRYIGQHVEPQIPGLGWEKFRPSGSRRFSLMRTLSQGGLFLGTQLFALVIGAVILAVPETLIRGEWLALLAFDLLSVALTALIVWNHRRFKALALAQLNVGDSHWGTLKKRTKAGLLVDIGAERPGILETAKPDHYSLNSKISVVIKAIDMEKKRIMLIEAPPDSTPTLT